MTDVCTIFAQKGERSVPYWFCADSGHLFAGPVINGADADAHTVPFDFTVVVVGKEKEIFSAGDFCGSLQSVNLTLERLLTADVVGNLYRL